MKDNKDNNLDETKEFKTIEDDTLEIPTFNNSDTDSSENEFFEDFSEEEYIYYDNYMLVDEPVHIDEELIDDGYKNLQAAEEELNKIFNQQNGDNGDSNMKKKLSKLEKLNAFLLFVVTMMIISFIGAGMFWYSLTKGRPELDIAALANEKQSILYDNNKEPFFDLGMYSLEGTSYDDITYALMSENIIDAFVAIEDSRFFKHKGFDIPRFTKAIFENIVAKGFAQGGSTITMQLIKTSHLSADKAIDRKAQEITLSLDLEKAISKDKILQYYVNKINYGAGNSRGLESASEYFFAKSASELSVSEAALLAGVINRPNAFSPIQNLEAAYKRRNEVLDMMVFHGYLDSDEAALAKAVKIENQLSDEKIKELQTSDNPYIDYVNAVIDEIEDRLGIDIVATPLHVYTHMDREVQEDIHKVQEQETFIYPDDYIQSAIAIGDNDTGALIALGAGRDSQVMKGRNRATRMFQQPGSVTKPLLSYALAFEHLGWATSHVVEDKPVQYAGTNKYLSNYHGRYQGEAKLKDAVANSLNTPAYLTLLDVQDVIGRNGVANYLRDSLGFSRVTNDEYNPQYAIGGSTFSISPAELFGAQAVMMNGGYYTKPHTIDYVETMDGEIIKDEFDYPTTKVISEETAYLVSVLEEYNVSVGIVNRMEVLRGRPYKVYAKTGTTDYADTAIHLGIPEGAGKDQWMMASSRKYSSIVWMGYDKAEAGKETWWTLAKYNANPLGKINNLMLDSVHRGKDHPGSVLRPAGITDITHVLSTFPYANPIEGIDSEYITTGEINRKYLNLVDLENELLEIEQVEDFKAKIEISRNTKTVSMSWTEYPEDGNYKSETYDISLGSVKATGTRLFHPSWVFGEPKYKATIYVDNVEYEEIESDENEFSKSFEIPNDAAIKICGYYGNTKQKGPERCVNVDNPDTVVYTTVPRKNITIADMEMFINQNQLNRNLWVEVAKTPTNKANEAGLVANISMDGASINNREFDVKDLKEATIEYSLYEYIEDDPADGGNGFRFWKYFFG